jgi:hypothetical protein
MAKVKTDKSPTITGKYEVPDGWVKELNFFDTIHNGITHSNNELYHYEFHRIT